MVEELKGDPRFHAILREMALTHDRKQADYGTDEDPFANYSSSEEFGVPAWKSAILRANEKMNRLKTYCKKGTLVNEGVEDAFLDLAVCTIISLVKWREQNEAISKQEDAPKLNLVDNEHELDEIRGYGGMSIIPHKRGSKIP